jgi:hypothetical protein
MERPAKKVRFFDRCLGVFRPRTPGGLVFVQIFFRDVVLGDLMRPDFLLVGVVRGFHTGDSVGFEGVSLFDQLVDALEIGTLTV